MTTVRDTYKYWFKIGNLRVHCGITNNLERREGEHKASRNYTTNNGSRYYWKDGHITQVGNITTKVAAILWEKQNDCNDNWE